jgi:hypothetical protein
MSDGHQPTPSPIAAAAGRSRRGLPSLRAAAALAAAMLALGVGIGAAIGPAPESSRASGLNGSLAGLIATVRARAQAQRQQQARAAAALAEAQEAQAESEEAAQRRARRRRRRRRAASSAASATPAASTPETPAATKPKTSTPRKALPQIGNVWLIELAGGSFSEAAAQAAAAPYIDSQAVPEGTLLGEWSAQDASAFAAEATLAEPVAEGATPPLLHSVVQPACPEGAAGASCAAGAGQLTAADEFLKATLAQITATAAYREHGLVVITFASVGLAAQQGLPAGASSATLTYRPPSGVLLLSPFVRAGSRSAAAFNPTSPRQSLETLLR